MKEIDTPKTVIVNGVETRAQRYTQPVKKKARHLGRHAMAFVGVTGAVAAAPHVANVAGDVWKIMSTSETELIKRGNVDPADAPKPHDPQAREEGVAEAEAYLQADREAEIVNATELAKRGLTNPELRTK